MSKYVWCAFSNGNAHNLYNIRNTPRLESSQKLMPRVRLLLHPQPFYEATQTFCMQGPAGPHVTDTQATSTRTHTHTHTYTHIHTLTAFSFCASSKRPNYACKEMPVHRHIYKRCTYTCTHPWRTHTHLRAFRKMNSDLFSALLVLSNWLERALITTARKPTCITQKHMRVNTHAFLAYVLASGRWCALAMCVCTHTLWQLLTHLPCLS